MMSEEQAKTKWCFASVASHTDPRQGFREHHEPEHYKEFPCLGSACMAWRFDTEGFEAAIESHEDSFNIGGITHRETPKPRGYCGLAGKP